MHQSHAHNTQSRHAPLVIVTVLMVLISSLTHNARAQPNDDNPRGTQNAAPPKLTSFKSRSYTVQTNLSVEEARPIALHMDAVYAEYARRFASFRALDKEAMPLYLLRKQADYEALLKSNGINATNTGGMFFVQRSSIKTFQGLATFVEGRSRSETYAVLQHEGFHQFAFRHIGDELPTWVNEGLAQYFEDGILTPRGFIVGLANARRVASVRNALNENRAFNFGELLGMSSEIWRQNVSQNPQKATLQYDQSWSIIYFLIHAENGKFRPSLEQYLKLVSKKTPSRPAFTRVFGTDSEAPFYRRWSAFALDAQPDPVNIALERMNFLGAGLQFLTDRGEPAPQTLDELKQALRAIQFRMTRAWPGLQITYDASDDAIFGYPHKNTNTPFTLLEPSADKLPPRLSAPGLKPEPTLNWSRDQNGTLIQDVTFR